MIRQRRITALNAVTATTTSSKFWVGGAKRIGLHYRRADHSSGSTAFTVKASLEPLEIANGPLDAHNNLTGGSAITMTALNMLVSNVTNTNAQTRTRVNSVSLAANGDAIAWLEPDAIAWLEPDILVNWLEITATETTDGTHSAWIVLEEELPQMAGA
jgi:hypothetical protein